MKNKTYLDGVFGEPITRKERAEWTKELYEKAESMPEPEFRAMIHSYADLILIDKVNKITNNTRMTTLNLFFFVIVTVIGAVVGFLTFIMASAYR